MDKTIDLSEEEISPAAGGATCACYYQDRQKQTIAIFTNPPNIYSDLQTCKEECCPSGAIAYSINHAFYICRNKTKKMTNADWEKFVAKNNEFA